MLRIELIVDDELNLRQFSPEDAQVIFGLIDRNREHLSQNGDDTSRKYPNLNSVLGSIKHPNVPSRLRFGIWAGETYVGTVNLTPQGNSAEIGYYLGSEFTGRGYVTKAVKRILVYGFNDLALKEIWGLVAKTNQKSIGIFKRIGFTLDEIRSDENNLFYMAKEDILRGLLS